MNPSRRLFLQSAAGAAAGLLLHRPPLLAASTEAAQQPNVKGLLFDTADLPRIRQTLQLPRFAPLWKSMTGADLDADHHFLDKELAFDNQTWHLDRARRILERSAFVFAVSGERRHADLAVHAIEKILQFSRWDYFLEGGEETIGLQRAPETTIAMAFGSEWLGDALNVSMKKEIERQIGEKGAPACYLTLFGMRYPDRVKGWSLNPRSSYKGRFSLKRWPIILNTTNLKAIPIAGLGIAASVLYGKHPHADSWLEMSLESARRFSSTFGGDGSYGEGTGYWGYTILYLTMVIEVLYRRLKKDERTLLNFPGTVRFALQTSMPTAGRPGDSVNFGDAGSLGDISVAAWTARERKDPIAQYVALNTAVLQTPYAAVWYDPGVQPAVPGKDLYDVRFANDWVVGRSGWDERSGVVAMRSGGPANHEHADRNSVVFKAYGQRLFHDPMHAAYTPSDPLWLLRQTEAHTALLIGRKGHQYHDGSEGTNSSQATAQIVHFQKDDRFMSAVSDATLAYKLVNADVSEVLRSILFIKPDILLLFDRVRLAATPLQVQLRYQVDNDDGLGVARVDGTSFMIMRPGVTLQGEVHGISPVRLRTDFLDIPSAKEPFPFVEAEETGGTMHQVLTVCTAQETGRWHGRLSVRRDMGLWHIEGAHNGRRVRVAVDTRSSVPAFSMDSIGEQR